ncbi:MAG: FAD:protein FMN transferase [Gammaproteobacteria bacterium]|nr:FAD:protein FMN transferase [Gammaproteobacteria bacterium]
MNINLRFFTAVFYILLLTACQPSEPTKEMHQQQLFAFGTLIDISIVSDDASQAQLAINEISSEFDRLHIQWHPWKEGDLGQANQRFSSSETFTSTPSIIKLIKDSQHLSEKSNGLFNPAIGQLIKLWQFDQIENEDYQFKIPAPEQIQSLLAQNPEMQDIVFDKDQLSSNNSAVSLDFGAFAKGVAIEKMMSVLKKHRIDNALINAGGDLKVLGSKNGKAWKIGIKNPANADNPSEKAIIAAIELKDNEALFTSGNYERFFEYGGKRYHHILDPRTGFPAVGTQSVTILTEDAALADAASTALFIAGPELWQEIAKEMNVQYVMLITDDDKIYLTQSMAERIELFTEIKPIIVK